ncbi:MAG: hypothetical protein ACOCUB_01285 [Desulfohalobiaceae bacterium]
MIRYRLRLEARLRSCLLTILDLEGELQQAGWRGFMQLELAYLQRVLSRLGSLPLQEQEVQQVEQATRSLLLELQGLHVSSSGQGAC